MSASATSSSLSQGDAAEFLTDLLGRDIRAAVSRLHDDVEWAVPGVPELGGGVHKGREAVLRFLALVGELFPKGLRITEVREWKSSGGSVIEAVLEGATASGAAYRNRYAFMIEMEGQTVRRVREYTDTSHAEKLLKTHSTRSHATEGEAS